MASLDELKEALLQTLAAKGSLGQMKARIRSEIFSALDQQDDAPSRAPLSNTNLLLNELIREYLAFNQYRYTLNVFLPEANQPEVPPFDRAFISKELHVQENQHSVQIPLLYSIVALLQQGKVADSSSGVSMTESGSSVDGGSSSMAAGAYQPAASASSTGSSYAMQPGQPSFHYPSDAAHAHAMHRSAQQQQQHPQAQQPQQQPQSHQQPQRSSQFGDDAPKPLQFTNRQ